MSMNFVSSTIALYHRPHSHTKLLSPTKDTKIYNFSYNSQPLPDKLLFIGTLQTGKRICIKFVRHYSDKAHAFCASMEFAPALIGFERLPGSWYMVVMDEDYENLHQAPHGTPVPHGITEKIVSLHQAGFVHGDIRDTNVMVRKDGEMGFMVVDFDWAGEIGVVRYPMNVNRAENQWRPDGASDGNVITAHHDIQMLEEMLLNTHLRSDDHQHAGVSGCDVLSM
jgi:hypothetical protein